MGVILKEIIDEIQNSYKVQIIAGHQGLDRRVRWIHIVEDIEISSFLQGQELVFMTGVGLDSHGDLHKLIKENIKNGASGMFINIGPFIKEVPQESIDYCNEKQFPIFTVPWDVKMANIMKVVTGKIFELENKVKDLSRAFERAIFFPKNENIYKTVFSKYNISRDSYFTIAIIHGKDIHSTSYLFLQNIDKILILPKEKKHLLFLEESLIIIFIDVEEKLIGKNIQKISNYIYKGYKETYIGIGKTQKGINKLYISYKQAQAVLSINKKVGLRKNAIVNYDGMEIINLLLAIEDRNILMEYYENTLGPLVNYDRLNNMDLVKVLECYLQNDCSVQDTAKDLFIHRNTVNYKIRRAKEILNCNLWDMSIKVKLTIAFMIEKIIL